MPTKYRGRRIRKIAKRLAPEIRAVIEASAKEIVRTQRSLAPERSGDLKRSIVYTMGDQDPPKYAAFKGKSTQKGNPALAAIITAGNSDVRYAHLVEFGTAPHIILGTRSGLFGRRKAMGMDGRFGTKVSHPGAEASPFFFPGYRAHRKKVRGRVTKAINKAIKSSV